MVDRFRNEHVLDGAECTLSARSALGSSRQNVVVTQGDLRRGLVFDEVVEAYDEFRPGYAPFVFDAIDARVPAGARRALEIGCGTGQGTQGLLERGWNVLAIEPGENFVRVAREKFASRPFEVQHASFEDASIAAGTFDFVFSATAFHWIDPQVRWRKSASALCEHGHLALVTHVTLAGATFNEFYEIARDVCARYLGVDNNSLSPTYEDLRDRASGAEDDIGSLWEVVEPRGSNVTAGELFSAPSVTWYPWRAHYTTYEALGLLSTFSNYLGLSRDERASLFREFAVIIDKHFAGLLERQYVTVLALAEVA